jgi:hypothetical protein
VIEAAVSMVDYVTGGGLAVGMTNGRSLEDVLREGGRTASVARTRQEEPWLSSPHPATRT